MELKAFDAANAYAKVSGTAISGASGGASSFAGAAGGESFGDLLKGMVGEVGKATRGSENMAAQAVANKAGVVDVVTEVSNAEMVVNTVVAVRDKVIQAYQDIIRMPI